jgi:hypothetical protein
MSPITVYRGYKNGRYVARIHGADRDWCLRFKRWFHDNWYTSVSLRGAKAAWRRIDGPGTRWREKP